MSFTSRSFLLSPVILIMRFGGVSRGTALVMRGNYGCTSTGAVL